jgi:hypothetical protein
VIATTLRLWVQRHVVPAWRRATRARRLAAGSWRRRVAGGFAAIAVVAGAVTAYAIASGAAAPSPVHANRAAQATPKRPSLPSLRAIAAAATSRQQAAAWVAAQVSRGVIVGCDPLMCAALLRHGFPPADLAILGASAGDPLGSVIVMSTTAIRSQLGPSLARVYAPAVIASFGADASLVQVRVVTPGGVAAYAPAERADLQARQAAGRELAGNRNIQEPAAAKATLVSGRVDSRLLMTLAALAAGSRIHVLGFSDAGPGAGAHVPLRQLTLATSSTSNLHQLLSFLSAQRPPLRAIVSQHREGRTVTVQIRFPAPNPTGLLPASTTLALTAAGS